MSIYLEVQGTWPQVGVLLGTGRVGGRALQGSQAAVGRGGDPHRGGGHGGCSRLQQGSPAGKVKGHVQHIEHR